MSRESNKTVLLTRIQDIAISKNGELLSSLWITAKTKYQFRCKEKHVFEMTADKITTRGDWCPYCAGRYGDFEEEIRVIIEDINGGNMLSPYVNNFTPIKCQCAKGHINYSTPSNLKAGKWCGKCIISHGEEAIKKHLDLKNISYIQQYRYADLRGTKYPLAFDFAIMNKDKVSCLIEYQGEQHYRPMRHSDRLEENTRKFEETQRNDKLKVEYCSVNEIPLIIISCLDFNEKNMKAMKQHIDNVMLMEVYDYCDNCYT